MPIIHHPQPGLPPALMEPRREAAPVPACCPGCAAAIAELRAEIEELQGRADGCASRWARQEEAFAELDRATAGLRPSRRPSRPARDRAAAAGLTVHTGGAL